MKRLIIGIGLFLVAKTAIAQQPGFPARDSTGSVTYYEHAFKSFKRLENYQSDGQGTLRLRGATSSVYFNEAAIPAFKTTQAGIPSLSLFEFQVNGSKNERNYVWEGSKPVSLQFRPDTIGHSNAYLIALPALKPGEYGLVDPTWRIAAFSVRGGDQGKVYAPVVQQVKETSKPVAVVTKDTIIKSKPIYSKECERYRKIQKMGMGLTIGGGVTALAAVGCFIGAAVERRSVAYGGIRLQRIGAGLMAPASVALGAGIPLWIIGKNKTRALCNTQSLLLIPEQNGLGLALQF